MWSHQVEESDKLIAHLLIRMIWWPSLFDDGEMVLLPALFPVGQRTRRELQAFRCLLASEAEAAAPAGKSDC